MNLSKVCSRHSALPVVALLATSSILAMSEKCRAVGPVAPSIAWARQLGTSTYDVSQSVATDTLGNVYISGMTLGGLFGPNIGGAELGTDAFIAKYNSSGNLLWSQQFGTSGAEQGIAVTTDGLGNVYVSGETSGNFGGTSAGQDDAYVRKYSSSGAVLWTQQLGTSTTDTSHAVSADALGNVFISGSTLGNLGGTNAGNYDAFVSKYTSSGTLVWSRQFGTSGYDDSQGVTADGFGNVIVTGTNAGSVFVSYVRKYDGSGNVVWSRNIPSSASVFAADVTADAFGNAYVTGSAHGSVSGSQYAGINDAFLVKYNPSGNLLWAREIGTNSDELGTDVSLDSSGNVYLGGWNFGSFGGAAIGEDDLFACKFDSSGNLLWTKKFGTVTNDITDGLAVDNLGNVFVAGSTQGSLAATNAGDYDAFLVKLSEVPEAATSSTVLFATMLISGLRPRGRRMAPLSC